jgi:exopolyphosphatase/guanosine-5'-triphosphate,3'-diphosphate pyrophosphatase
VLAALLRLADALDRQHRGAVGDVAVRVEGGPGRVTLVLHGAQPGSLELHSVRDKGRLFEEVFGVTLGVETA